MDVDELKKLLADKTAKRDELPDVEFKESADRTFFESICSLANAWGGVIVLGVDKHGAIVGVPPPRGQRCPELILHRTRN